MIRSWKGIERSSDCFAEKISLARLRCICEVDIPNRAPIVDGLVMISATVVQRRERATYQATQILAPATRVLVPVKVVEQDDEPNCNSDQGTGSDQPPRPP